MKTLTARRCGVGFAAAILLLQPFVRACNLEQCIFDVLKIPTVDAGDATKGYLQAAEEDNPLKLATTSKDITDEVLQTVDSCKGCSVSLYPLCSTDPGGVASAHTRSCGGDDQIVQATGERRCASYATQVSSLVAGDIFFGKQNQFVFHCNNTHGFDGINSCFYDCSTCDQCASQKAAGEAGPASACPAPAPGADPTTARNNLTAKANHCISFGAATADENPDDVALDNAANATSKHRRRDPKFERISASLANLALEDRSISSGAKLVERVAESDLVPVPKSTWWKYTNANAGYRFEGNKYSDAWALVYKDAFTQVSDMGLGPVPKVNIPNIPNENGGSTVMWESDHVLEAQILSQFFLSNRVKYNDLLRELVKGWLGPQAPEDTVVTTFSNFGNCNIQNIATVLNGPGNVQPLDKGLNGFKGGVFYGYNQQYSGNNAMAIAGVLNYMHQVTAMHDATAEAIGKLIDAVPNAGGTFGDDFVNFAKSKWGAVGDMLTAQYAQAAGLKPLLQPGATSGPLVELACSNLPPPPAPSAAPSSSGLPGPMPTLKVRRARWRA